MISQFLSDELSRLKVEIHNDLSARFPSDRKPVISDAIDLVAELAVFAEHLRLDASEEWDLASARNFFGTVERLFLLLHRLGPGIVAETQAEKLMARNLRYARAILDSFATAGHA